ncbi:MAG TPA: VIT1/CCC1 transporter family protein [Patescibacteria group bacterium]|nr:VIT1/CCC1 transporter family protein [Patescibacteria group bacterium]
MHLGELSRKSQGNTLSDMILGGQDGLVNVLGVILGVAAASGNMRIIIAGGLAATFAESISMAAVALTSKMAERDHYFAELEREKREIVELPDREEAEIREIYAAKGFSGKLLDDIVKHIISDDKRWLDQMMTDELGLIEISQKEIYISSLVVGFSALAGSFIPLTPYFFLPIQSALVVTLIISAVVLFIVGFYKAKLTVGQPAKSGIQMAIIGMTAAIAGYLIGKAFGAN